MDTDDEWLRNNFLQHKEAIDNIYNTFKNDILSNHDIPEIYCRKLYSTIQNANRFYIGLAENYNMLEKQRITCKEDAETADLLKLKQNLKKVLFGSA